MKQILTVLVCKNYSGEGVCTTDEPEILYTDGGHSESDILKGGIKQASGKYIVFSDGRVGLVNFAEFSEKLKDTNADIVTFDGGTAYKASALRALGTKELTGRLTAELYAALSLKTIERFDIKPLELGCDKFLYSPENTETLRGLVTEFGRSKSKVPKDVYSFCRNLLCEKLVTFYMSAIYDAHRGKADIKELVAFDTALKSDIVLYLAVSKNFEAADLQKLRNKGFKIGFFTANKLKKLLEK